MTQFSQGRGRKFIKMRSLYCLALIQLVSVFGFAAQGETGKFDKLLSPFPGYHIFTLDERDPDTRAILVQHFAKKNPSVIEADFDGDGHLDYALLLKNAKTANTKLVVLLCSSTLPCKSVYDLDLTGSAGEVYLKRIPAGALVSQTEAVDTGENTIPVKLNSAGIRLVYFEKAEVVLYWDTKLGKIQEIQTGD